MTFDQPTPLPRPGRNGTPKARRVGPTDPGLVPEGADAKAVAREQFVHGLLAFLVSDDRDRQRQRVSDVMTAIGGGAEKPAPVLKARFNWRSLSGLAAALALCGTLILLWPTTPTALAMVQSTLTAAKSAGDRRYEIRVTNPGGGGPGRGGPGPVLIGTIDVRSADRTLMKIRTPRGEEVAFGRDALGEWALTPEGEITRDDTRRGKPRWLDLGENTLMVQSVEDILAALPDAYALNRKDPEALPADAGAAASGTVFNRLSAVHRGRGPGPEHIEFWIDRETKLVQRMELHWGEAAALGGPDRRERGDGAEPAAHPEGPQANPDGPPGPRGPRGGGERGPGSSRAQPGTGPGSAELLAGLLQPGGGRPGGPGGPGGPGKPGGPGGPGGPSGPGGPGHQGPGGPGPGPGPGPTPSAPGGPNGPNPGRPGPGGPEGPRGPGPGPGPGPGEPGAPNGGPPPPFAPGFGGPGGRRPYFMEKPPDFGRDRCPPPPRMVVLTRVETPELSEDWFSPEAHKKK